MEGATEGVSEMGSTLMTPRTGVEDGAKVVKAMEGRAVVQVVGAMGHWDTLLAAVLTTVGAPLLASATDGSMVGDGVGAGAAGHTVAWAIK